MLTLFKNAMVFNPGFFGIKDVLTGGTSILAIEDNIAPPPGMEVTLIGCSGLMLVPGLIDAHVHITGGGGEGGPASRMPELQLSMMLEAGVTTVVGCLGTDGITRTVESVLMKVKSLRSQGVSAWMYTGAYQVPTPTITGDIAKDIALFEEIIGVGEIAISDHRSSLPSVAELARIAAQARVAGMIGGKGGIVNLHMGDAREWLQAVSWVTGNFCPPIATEMNISLKIRRNMARRVMWISPPALIRITWMRKSSRLWR